MLYVKNINTDIKEKNLTSTISIIKYLMKILLIL